MLEVCEGGHELGSCTGLSVLDYSDTCFREKFRRSDPRNQALGAPQVLSSLSCSLLWWSSGTGHRKWSSCCWHGLRCWDVCELQGFSPSSDVVLAPRNCVSYRVDACSSCVRFQCVVSFVLGWLRSEPLLSGHPRIRLGVATLRSPHHARDDFVETANGHTRALWFSDPCAATLQEVK